MSIFGVRDFTSISGVCELQHGQNSTFWVHKSKKKEESWNLVRVSKILDSIFGVLKTVSLILGASKQIVAWTSPHIES